MSDGFADSWHPDDEREDMQGTDTLASLPPLKPHQVKGIDQLREHRLNNPGVPAVGVAPPGAGKSRAMIELTKHELSAGGRVIIYVHRTMLREQMFRVFQSAGVPCAELAAGCPVDLSQPVQIASIQSVHSWCIKSSKMELPDATLVMKDEAHQQASDRSREVVFGSIKKNGAIVKGHSQLGADVLGMTATPLFRAGLYQKLIPFGTCSELRAEQMHLPVKVVSGDEIDTTGLKANAQNEYSEGEIEKRSPMIFGSAYDEWQRWNPDAYPAILFGPSVAGASWFANEWAKKGVMSAFIGGEEILLPERTSRGEVILKAHPSSREGRDEVLARSESGEIPIIMNRFVLREAIDMPWLYHAIFATVMGSLTTYLQSAGRIQRYHPRYTYKLLQDHGGGFWRHGSPNEDREWTLGDTNVSVAKQREIDVGADEKMEPIRCEECGAVRAGGSDRCWNCQRVSRVSVRMVRQLDGKLKEMKGKVYKPRSKSSGKSAGDLWRTVWFSCAYQDRSVKQAVARWHHKCRSEGVFPDESQIKPELPKPGSHEYENSMMQAVFPKLRELGHAKGGKKRGRANK